MKNSKKGFTLSEVLIVVAIIVIVSAAGMAGIAIAVQDANARGEKIQQLHGEGNWEAAANQKIKDNVPTLGPQDVYEESLDTPSTSTPTPTATDKPESTPTSTPASTPKPTTTPASTPKPTTTPASTPKPTTTPASTPKPTTQPTSGGSTKSLTGNSQYDLQTSATITGNGSGIKSVTISVPDGVTLGNVSNIDNGGKYKMSTSDDKKSVTIYYDESTSNWSSPSTSIYIGNFGWSGPQNIDVTYTIEYAS